MQHWGRSHTWRRRRRRISTAGFIEENKSRVRDFMVSQPAQGRFPPLEVFTFTVKLNLSFPAMVVAKFSPRLKGLHSTRIRNAGSYGWSVRRRPAQKRMLRVEAGCLPARNQPAVLLTVVGSRHTLNQHMRVIHRYTSQLPNIQSSNQIVFPGVRSMFVQSLAAPGCSLGLQIEIQLSLHYAH